MADNFVDLVMQELKDIVMDSLNDIKPRYKEIIIMRCYKEMSYDEIARELECTEFSARVLFFRAKNALNKTLKKILKKK